MSSLVSYDISSSDEEDFLSQTSPNLPKTDDSDSSNIIGNTTHKNSNEFELPKCSDSPSDLKENSESQDNVMECNQTNIQDSSNKILNFQELSNIIGNTTYKDSSAFELEECSDQPSDLKENSESQDNVMECNQTNIQDSSNKIGNTTYNPSKEFELEECSDSFNDLNQNCESQENIMDCNQTSIQDSSTIVNIEESNNLNSLNDKDIEITVDKTNQTYREHEIINISVDTDDDSSSCSLDDDSSSLSESDSVDTFSISDDSSDPEIESSSGNKTCSNNVSQSNLINRPSKLCSYCLNLKNNAQSESIRPVENKSSSNSHNTQENGNVEHVDSQKESESSNMDTSDNNKESNGCDIEESSNNQNSKQEVKDNSSEYSADTLAEDSVSKDKMINNKESDIISNSNNNSGNLCTCEKNKKENFEKKQKPKKKLMSSYYDEIELPPIEDLHISVEENEAKPIGTILHTVGNLVIVKTYQGIPAINLDSVLFLDQGKRALGRVDDVFGPIYEPHYVVRFNSPEHIKEKAIEKEEIVYFAPQTDYTSFVILDDLINAKGSDASWKKNREPPEQLLDYSDDEEERRAKQALKSKKKERNQANGEITITKEFESQRKRVRSERPNPFSNTNFRGRSSHQARFISSSQYNTENRNSFQRNQNSRYTDDRWNNVRFGGPPNMRAGMQSPFIPPPSPSPSLCDEPHFNSYPPPKSPAENSGWHRFVPPPSHSPPCFSSMSRPSTPLPPPTFPYNNNPSSPSHNMNSFNTPPPPPPSPIHLNQSNLHTPPPHMTGNPTNFASNFSQPTRNPPPFANNNPHNNTLGSLQSWPQNPQNHGSFQNSVGTFNPNPPFQSQNYFQSSGNVPPLNSSFQPHTQNPPHHQINPPPMIQHSNIYNSNSNISNPQPQILPNMSNPPPPVSPNMRNPPPQFSQNNQIPFQGLPPPPTQRPYHNRPPNF